MHLNFRQGIVSYPQTGTTQSFLTKTGQYVSLSTANGQVTIAFAHANRNYAYTETTSVNNAWGPLQAGQDYWLFWDIDLRSGVRTFGTTTLEPKTQATQPMSIVDQHWFDTTTNKMMVCLSNGRWVEKIRTFAAKVNSSTFYPLGVGFPDKPYAGTQVHISGTDVIIGKILLDDDSKPIRRSDGTFFTSEDTYISDGSTLTVGKIEQSIITGTALENLAQYQIVKLSTNGTLDSAKYDDTGSSMLAMLMEGLTIGQVGTITLQGIVTNPAWNWARTGDELWVNDSGQLTTVDPHVANALLYPIGRVPVARVISQTSVYFSQGLGGKGENGIANIPQGLDASKPVFATTGDLYIATDTKIIYRYNGSSWDAIGISQVTLEGDVVGVGTGTITTTLAPLFTPVPAPQVLKGTVDAAGRVTSVNGVLPSDLLSILGYVPINKAGDTMTGSLLLSSDPSVDMQATTKRYVDLHALTSTWKYPVKIASTTSEVLSGIQIIDTLATGDGDRVLIKNQNGTAAHPQNGIWITSTTGPWSRAPDFNSSTNMISGSVIYVENGTQAGQAFVLATSGTITPDTTPISFTSFNNAQLIVLTGAAAGSGTTSIPVTLTNSGVVPGTYTQVTVNNAGQVTAASVPTTLAGYSIQDAVNKAGDTMTGPLTLYADPTLALQAATKQYVDTRTSGPGFTVAGGLTLTATTLAVTSANPGRIVVNPGNIDLATTGVIAGTYNQVTVDAYGRVTTGSTVGNQLITLSGDATGTGTSSIVLTLANSGVVPGTYTQLTVDSKGRVTTASSPTTLAGLGITDGVKKSGDTMTGNLVMGTSDISSVGNFSIQRVKDPINPQDVATKSYVDSATGAVVVAGNGLAFTGNVLNVVPVSSSRLVAASGTLDLATTGVVAGTYTSVTVDAYGRVSAGSTPPPTNALITLSGDVTGSGTSTIVATLANSGVTQGLGYNKFTVNAKGLITSATTETTLAGLGITDSINALSDVTITAPSNLQVLTFNGVEWINATPATATDKLVGASPADTAPGYLNNKLGLSANFATSIGTPGGNEVLNVDLSDTTVTAGGPYNTFSVDAKGRITAASNTAGSNQPITLSGDATGTGTTAITVTLADTGVVAGTYKSVTVDSKGRVTTATNPTTLVGYGITDAQPLDVFLTNISGGATGNGILVKNYPNPVYRSIAGTAGRIAVANGSGLGGNPTIDLASGVLAVPGTYTKVTVDTYGRVTNGATITTADVGGLGTLSLQNSTAISVTGGSITGTKVLPRIVTVAYAATVTLDWSTADIIRITLTGDITITNSAAGAGQKCILELMQDAIGNHAVTFTTETRFGTDILGFTATVTPNKLDRVGMIYSEVSTTYDVVAIVRGY